MARSLLDGADLARLRLAGLEGGPTALALACLLQTGAAQHDPGDPEWPDRDRVLVDPALPLHAVAAVLGRAGYPVDEGRLGQGPGRVAADAVRAAAASREAGDPYRVFLLLDAASLGEGRVWEALVTAGRERLDTLHALVVPSVPAGPQPRAVFLAAGWHPETAAADPAEILGGLDRALLRTAGPLAVPPSALVLRSP